MGHMVDVELDGEPAAGIAGLRPRRRWGARAWSTVAAAIAVLAAGATVTHGVGTAGRVPVVVGLVPDLTHAREELWRADAAWVYGVVDDVVIVSRDGEVAGLDWDTGEQVWASDAWSCWVADPETPEPGHPRTSARITGPAWVVCSSWTEEARTIRVLDPSDGSQVAQVSASAAQTAVVLVDEVLVVLDLSADATVTAVSTSTGDQAWSRELDGPLYEWWVAADLLVLVTAGSDGGTLALDLATGEPDPTPGPWVLGTEPLADGGELQNRVAADGTAEAVALDGDGALRWAFPGHIRRPPAGSVVSGGVVSALAYDGALVVLDIEFGDQAWSTGDLGYPLVSHAGVLAGLAFGADGQLALDAVDAATGDVAWTAPLATLLPSPVVLTDGEHVALAEGDPVRLVVRDLHSGEVAGSWALPGQGPSAVLALPDGRLAQVAGLVQSGTGDPAGPTLIVLR